MRINRQFSYLFCVKALDNERVIGCYAIAGGIAVSIDCSLWIACGVPGCH